MDPHVSYTISDDCLECGNCIHVCPTQAIESRLGRNWINAKYCNKCGACAEVCPTGAAHSIDQSPENVLFNKTRASS